MSRVLFLAPAPPWPGDNGGRIRTAALLRQLSKDHEITLWCVAKEDGSTTGEEVSAELCAHLEIFARTQPSWLQQLSGPIQEQWFASEPLRRRLQDISSAQFDLIHVDELCLIRHLPPKLSVPVVQHHHKLDYELAGALRPPGARRKLELERWQRLEQESVARTRHHVFCSQEDAQRFAKRHSAVQTLVVPNGVDTHFFDGPGPPRYAARLLLLGDLEYEPNRRGIQSFLDEVWPSLRAARGDLQLSIVGRGAESPDAAQLPAGVQWIGEVSDVRPWLAQASALVVPLGVGGGTRLKILEAAAARCPVLTTRVGLEGLRLVHGEHLLAVESIADLRAGVLDCLNYPERAAGRATYAKEFVRRHYEWREIARTLADGWRRFSAG